MEHDGKLSESSSRAKRGGRFWVELDNSGNLDSIFALLLLCAVHYCALFYWLNTWNRLVVFKFSAINQFKGDIAITPGFYKPLKKKLKWVGTPPIASVTGIFVCTLICQTRRSLGNKWQSHGHERFGTEKVVSLTKLPLLMGSHLCQYHQSLVIKLIH